MQRRNFHLAGVPQRIDASPDTAIEERVTSVGKRLKPDVEKDTPA